MVKISFYLLDSKSNSIISKLVLEKYLAYPFVEQFFARLASELVTCMVQQSALIIYKQFLKIKIFMITAENRLRIFAQQ